MLVMDERKINDSSGRHLLAEIYPWLHCPTIHLPSPEGLPTEVSAFA